MLKIRMQRIGRTNMPSFRIIVAEHTEGPKTGSIVEKVGTYNPKSKEKKLETERIKYWISVGARPSPTVHNMLVSEKIISGKKINVLPRKSPPKVEEGDKAKAEAETTSAGEAAKESSAEEKAEEVTAAPAEVEEEKETAAAEKTAQ